MVCMNSKKGHKYTHRHGMKAAGWRVGACDLYVYAIFKIFNCLNSICRMVTMMRRENAILEKSYLALISITLNMRMFCRHDVYAWKTLPRTINTTPSLDRDPHIHTEICTRMCMAERINEIYCHTKCKHENSSHSSNSSYSNVPFGILWCWLLFHCWIRFVFPSCMRQQLTVWIFHLPFTTFVARVFCFQISWYLYITFLPIPSYMNGRFPFTIF